MSRSLKIKATLGGVICIALVTFDIASGLRHGWDIENLVKDVILIAVVAVGIWYERRYYVRLAKLSPQERDRALADKLPDEREKILLKLKEDDV